jgi:hypothetical protein
VQVLATFALMASLMGAGSPGGDDTLAEAKAHVEAARKAFSVRKFDVALQEFQAAQRLKPAPVLWFNIGKCYEKLNETPSALRAFRTYLHEAPGTSDLKEVEKAITRLEGSLRGKGVQQLMVFAQPPNATASIPGKGSFPVPAAWELRPGTYTVTVSASGHQSSAQPVTVTLKRSAQLEVTLATAGAAAQEPPPQAKPPPVATAEEPLPPLVEPQTPPAPPGDVTQGKVTVAVRPKVTPPSADAPVQPPPKAELGAVLAPPREPLPLSPPPPSRGRMWTWAAGGVSLAGVGAGVGFGLSASSASADLRNGTLRSEADATQLYARARSSALYANIGYGAAAAAGVTAVVLFLLEGQPSSASASAAPAAGGAPVVLGF